MSAGVRRSPIRMLCLLAAAAVGLACTASARPARGVRFGVYDPAWLEFGPGTLTSRAALLRRLGVQVVRVDFRWDEIAATAPASPADPGDPAYAWGPLDAELAALRNAGIEALPTLIGTPAWANGGRGPNWAPATSAAMSAFARAAATRFPWIRRWLVWDEPNQARWLRPTLPSVYVQRLLDPAYEAIHAVIPGALVGGGVTAPRAGAAGVAPAAWIAGMAAAGAELDAYAHNPYPSRPTETPFSGGCAYCADITMATIPRLLAAVSRAFGPSIPIWLTEYGYQTNPPDPLFGVTPALQAAYVGEAALRAWQTPRVELLVQFLVEDEPDVARWQSGLFTAAGMPKPSAAAFPLPIAQVGRSGEAVRVWGQVRPGRGVRSVRLQRLTPVGWRWIGAALETGPGGFWQTTIRAAPETEVRPWSAGPGFGAPVVLP